MTFKEAIEELKKGNEVECIPFGRSMEPYIYSGQTVKLKPAWFNPQVGNIVACKINENYYLHFIKSSLTTPDGNNNQYEICNAKGHVNGWTTLDKIYGVLA